MQGLFMDEYIYRIQMVTIGSKGIEGNYQTNSKQHYFEFSFNSMLLELNLFHVD